MTEIDTLLVTIKRLLKARGLTYRDLAQSLSISEPSVKRMFASRHMALDRLLQIAEVLGYTLAELVQEASVEAPIKSLSEAQEQMLVADKKLLLVAVCVLNHWKLADILDAYMFDEAECLGYLLRMDRLKLIELLPGNRIRLKISRDFEWLANGPIRQFFRTHARDEFLNGPFTENNESLIFLHGMLSNSAAEQLQVELKRLRRRFAELHEESTSAPLAQKQGASMLVANRYGWEPAVFSELRRVSK